MMIVLCGLSSLLGLFVGIQMHVQRETLYIVNTISTETSDIIVAPDSFVMENYFCQNKLNS
jgi:hypothetical protein